MTTISITSIPNLPGWTDHLYLTNDGDYYVATFKYDSIKDDCPFSLLPAGDN